ncbi:DUF2238 domain-containing protein [Paenisporosarcina quisquiliarum]|uniref:DUF2238 domain-containing protein n=1 Tax=Paenisporosarcina quisquiliarum TaxID=365346 RepID=UPI0037350F00
MKTDSKFKVHFSLLLLVIAVLIWSVIKPTEFLTWVAESSPSIVVLIILIAIYRKFRLTTLSYTIIAVLSILTFIGGHYTYSEVPLFNWLQDTYDLTRNHYDRFGHFLKGLSAIVVMEILIRKTLLKRDAWLSGITISIILAIAALYEIVEWLSTKLPYAQKEKEDFLGMQGDKWDAQWDMFLALVGSILALFIFSRLLNKQLKKIKHPN